jgi:hypothetical protein
MNFMNKLKELGSLAYDGGGITVHTVVRRPKLDEHF